MIQIQLDNITLNSDYVMALNQSSSVFSNAFRLGATVCRSYELNVDKLVASDFSNGFAPQTAQIRDANTQELLANLVVDEIDDTNDAYYALTLTDKMVRTAEQDNSGWFTSGATLQTLLNNICSYYQLGTAPTLPQYGTLALSWNEDMSARDFIGYVAELLGGFARISPAGNLVFNTFSASNTASDTIDVEDCDSFKVGQQIVISRVVYDNGIAKYEYGDDSGQTLYLNTDNALFTDDTTAGTVTIEEEVEYIYSIVNGFSFYNIKVGKCPCNDSVLPGDIIEFTLNGDTYNTIAQIEWNYNTLWTGGYELDLDNTIQEETKVISPVSKLNKIVTTIDRELGQVQVEVTTINDELDNLSIGARNLWIGSKDFSTFSSLSGELTGETYEDNEILYGTEISQSSDLQPSLTLKQDSDYILSFFAKGAGNVTVSWDKAYSGSNYGITLTQKVLIFASSASVNASQSGSNMYLNDETVAANDYVLDYGNGLQYIPLTNNWHLYVVKIKTNSDFYLDTRVLKIQGTNRFYLNSIMFEYGTVPTSWTPAPEDTDEAILLSQQATINITSSQILATVSKEYASKDEVDSISSSVSQTAEDLRIEFNRDIGDLEDRVETNEETVGQVNTYFKFSSENLQIGKDGSEMIMELDNDSLEFKANGTVVTWVDGKESVLGARELSLGEPGNNPRFRFLISRDGKHMRITRHS